MLRSTHIALLLLATGFLYWLPIRASQAQVFVGNRDIVAMYLFQGQDEATFKRRLEAKTSLRFERLSELLELDASQIKKVDLALKGDINRFYRELDAVREKTKGLNMQNQQEMQKAWQHVSPLYEKVMTKGILGDDSLFERVLEACLNEEQSNEYETYITGQRKRISRAIVNASLAEMERSIPLLAEQRTKILELLEDKKLPDRVVNQNGAVAFDGSSLLASIKLEELTEILDENQLAAFKKFRQARNRNLGGFILW